MFEVVSVGLDKEAHVQALHQNLCQYEPFCMSKLLGNHQRVSDVAVRHQASCISSWQLGGVGLLAHPDCQSIGVWHQEVQWHKILVSCDQTVHLQNR
jgi:hypothetical protein